MGKPRDQIYITDDWFQKVWRAKIDKKAETVAVFDCCHSGTMFDLPYIADPDTCKWSRDGKVTENEPFFMYLSGCQDQQTAAEVITKTARHGAMTRALTQAIAKLGDEVSLQKLLTFLRQKLKKHKSKDGKPQKPNICCTRKVNLETTTFASMFDGNIAPAKKRS